MSTTAAQPAVSALLRAVLTDLPGHWAQGDWHTIDDHRCLGGWIMFAANTTGNPTWVLDFHCAVNFVDTAARAELGTDDFNIVSWNDTPGRTEQEVVDLVNKALRLAQQVEAAVIH